MTGLVGIDVAVEWAIRRAATLRKIAARRLKDDDLLTAAGCEAEAERYEVLVARIKELEAHKCALPASIQEALNSGDGTYRP